jgi:hypothetical protein
MLLFSPKQHKSVMQQPGHLRHWPNIHRINELYANGGIASEIHPVISRLLMHATLQCPNGVTWDWRMATLKWKQNHQAAQGKESWMKKRNAKILNSEEYTHAETLIMYA